MVLDCGICVSCYSSSICACADAAEQLLLATLVKKSVWLGWVGQSFSL